MKNGEHLNQGMDDSNLSADGLVDIESILQVKYAEVFKNHRNKLDEDPAYSYCSCERLLTRARLTDFTAKTKKFSTDQWCTLKVYLAERDKDLNTISVLIAALCLMIQINVC